MDTSTVRKGAMRSRGRFAPDMDYCSVGGGGRPNEDYALFEEGLGACVADGVGGAPLGATVARLACHAAMRALREGHSAKAAVLAAQEAVLRLVDEVESPRSGTSLVVARIGKAGIGLSWAGDAAAFVYRREGDGRSFVSTLDTRHFASVPPLGRCNRCQAESLDVDSEVFESMAVCTDGLWRIVGGDEIAILLSADESARATASHIVFGRRLRDDATALVVRSRSSHDNNPSPQRADIGG